MGNTGVATNWPPLTYPSWPPPELNSDGYSAGDIRTLINTFRELGFTQRPPTPTEENIYFKSVRCDEGHPVIGRMLVSPSNVAYPFAVCTNGNHRSVLVLWSPYDMGSMSGVE